MQNQNSPGLFDPKTILAVIAVALMYGGWQFYLTKKYPNYGKPAAAVAETKQAETPYPPAAANQPTTTEQPAVAEASVPQVAQEQTFEYTGKKISFQISSSGMGLKNLKLLEFTNKDKEQISFATGSEHLFAMTLNGESTPIPFTVKEVGSGSFVGEAVIGDLKIQREFSYDEAKNAFSNKVTVENSAGTAFKGFSFTLPDKIIANKSSSFLFPSYDLQDFFVIHAGDKKETVNFNHAKENINKEFTVASTVAVGSQYFASALLDKSDILPKIQIHADVQSKNAEAKVVYEPTNTQGKITFEQLMYVGPKSIDDLKKIDSSLAKIVDFGFFDIIATPLLYVMKFCYGLVGNWGFAIILLTLLVRFVVLPFNIMSFRSMKAMQKIQPSVQALREKYKEDPMRLNQEMMSLMKENGANPLGGCLPMLLQIPIFFALYRVISSSVELYQSPFMFWINDLSAHDKFYVLPVLMAASMFIQQKLTPTTMDPTQAKIMLFLPLVMCLFMLQLPSGLTLYMFISTLFGIIQQMIIMRDSKEVAKK